MAKPEEQTAWTPGEVARAIFDSVAARDPVGIVRFDAPDYVADFVALGEFHGPDEVRRFFVEWFAAFPDFEVTVDRIVSDDRTAVVQWHATGTFTGAPVLGIRPTGRRVALNGVDIFEIEGGRARRATVYFDGATLARQIGILPKQDSIGDRALLAVFNLRTRTAKLIKRSPQPHRGIRT
jgi:steroid delta-isomerase-like uncharacterized protein